jgi:Na+-translocating ferredoxin:NAD+ oxidoreductase subunit B
MVETLVTRINGVLPQTQCTRCGYPNCLGYAEAIATGAAPINQCPPGGEEGIARLAALTGTSPLPLNTAHGVEGPRSVVWVDEAWCIGCTLCIKACPVDAVVGSNKRMHTVLEDVCTGCELCVPVCPVDCIHTEPAQNHTHPAPTGWAAWSSEQALVARNRYEFRSERLKSEKRESLKKLEMKAALKLSDLPAHTHHTDAAVLDKKRAVIEAALAKARNRAPAAG